MSIKAFWIIFVKILGILLIFSFLEILPLFYSMFIGAFSFAFGVEIILPLLVIFVLCFLYFLLIKIFLVKPNKIVKLLRLEKGLDEEKLDFKADNTSLLRVAIVFLGGYTFIEAFPIFCRFFYFMVETSIEFRMPPNFGTIIFPLLKTIFGYLIIKKSSAIVNFINRKNNSQPGNEQGTQIL